MELLKAFETTYALFAASGGKTVEKTIAKVGVKDNL
jgi:hypothetical protein